MTTLQKRFANSKLLRNRLYFVLLENGLARGNDKRLFNDIISTIYNKTPEAHIKCLLLQFLQCYDLTDAERMEAIELLQMAQTALTPAQKKRILEELNE